MLGKKAIQMASTWTIKKNPALGQLKVDAKSNEITPIPQPLEALALTGCMMTSDATNCQKDIAKQIIDQDVEHALALKEKPGGLAFPRFFGLSLSGDYSPCVSTNPFKVIQKCSTFGPSFTAQ